MTSGALQQILTLPPGAFYRSTSGFFQRLPNGAIAFLPSIFRLPWHAKQPRLVGSADIARLLRAETSEILVAVAILLVGVHYFFFDILRFYLEALSLPLAVLAHTVTLLIGTVVIFVLNNVPFSLMRSRMVESLPVARGALSRELLDKWYDNRRLWRLSFMSNRTAATLPKQAVLLYMVMFVCSLPLLLVIFVIMLATGTERANDGSVVAVFAVYCVLSLWAFLESTLVLRQRWKAGRRRRLARQGAGEAASDPATSIEV